MEEFKEQIGILQGSTNLSASIQDVEAVIEELKALRAKIAAEPQSAPLTLAKAQTPIKSGLDKAQKDLLPIYKGLGKYSKILDKKFKDKPLPSAENDALSSHPSLINRAIAMHLLREGEFEVASTFITEATQHPLQPEPTAGTPNPYLNESWEQDLANGTFSSQRLQHQFVEMYNILRELRENHNLLPAIEWARVHTDILEARGSNLEFELFQQQYICLFLGRNIHGVHIEGQSRLERLHRAWAYTRSEIGPFRHRYAKEIQHLTGAMAFAENLWESPYRPIFYNDSAWEEVAASFTREFCSLLGLSADSPLYIAATAGAIALPTLLKLQNIMKEKKTEWTTQDELPVEIPLPPSYHFHSIFVCPVSKEQSTDANPPMMMPCGHVIAKESLDRISKGNRFKCPYCPCESQPKDARKVVL